MGSPTWMEWELFWVQVLGLPVLVYYVLKTAEMASATRDSVVEMRESRSAEMSPYVVIYFDAFSRPGTVDLVLKNTGRTAARNVTFAFDRPCPGGFAEGLPACRALSEGIDFLPPGYEWRTFFGMGYSILPGGDETGVWHVVAEYDDEFSSARHSNTQTLDLEVFRGVTLLEHKGIDEATEALERVERTIGNIHRDLERSNALREEALLSTSGAAGPTVASRDQPAWLREVTATLRELRLVCGSLYAGDRERRVIPKLFHVRRRLAAAADQLLSLAASCPEGTAPPVARQLGELAATVASCARQRFFIDGGKSAGAFETAGGHIASESERLEAELGSWVHGEHRTRGRRPRRTTGRASRVFRRRHRPPAP